MTAFQLLATIESGEMEKAAADPLKLMQRVARTYLPRITSGVRNAAGEALDPSAIRATNPAGWKMTAQRQFEAAADAARRAAGTTGHSAERNELARHLRDIRKSRYDNFNSNRPTNGGAVVQPTARTVSNPKLPEAYELGMRDRINQWYGGLQPGARSALSHGAAGVGGGTLGFGLSHLPGGSESQPSGARYQDPNTQSYPAFYGGYVS